MGLRPADCPDVALQAGFADAALFIALAVMERHTQGRDSAGERGAAGSDHRGNL